MALIAGMSGAAGHDLSASSKHPTMVCAPTLAEMVESFDARVWAEAFVREVRQNPAIARDAETMTSWFANALMRGWDERERRSGDV